MSTISEKILNKIKENKLAPRPRWQFKLRDSGKWLGFGLLVVLTVVAVGLLMFFWSDAPWLNSGKISFGLLFGRMPIILMAIVIVGGLLALVDLKNTGRGYRYPLKFVGFGIIIFALMVGWLFNYWGFTKGVDSAISQVPFYQNQSQYMISVWQQPSEGRLTGEITKVESDNNFTLIDFSGKTWAVSSLGALWRHGLVPVAGLKIKMLGGELGNNGFEATDIRPFMPMNGGCGKAVMRGGCGMIK